MASFRIIGGKPLYGDIYIQGSKNAVLPIMAASLLVKGTCVLYGVPLIEDVYSMMEILKSLGAKLCLTGHRLQIDASGPLIPEIPEEQMRKMRSSIILLSPLLVRCKEASVCYPGGCNIGRRPVDLHLKALKALGAEIKEEGACISAFAANLTGASVRFPFPSVGATENALLAAVCAKGDTVLSGCAKEPEVEELCRFLNAAGACIKRLGAGEFLIRGTSLLREVSWYIPGDRIVAGTYLSYVAGCGGRLYLRGAPVDHMKSTLEVLKKAGVKIWPEPKGILCEAAGRRKAVPYIRTEPYPGFPTDMQSLILPVFSCADGITVVEETIFEGRFQAAGELGGLGAEVYVDGRRIIISGVCALTGNHMTATDLRGGAALVGAALMARGESRVENISHILRGYEGLERDIRRAGGEIYTET